MNIQKHIGNIDKKLDEYFQRNYILNKKYFSVTQYTIASPNVTVIIKGSGITMNEQQNIINCPVNVYQQKLEPISNNTVKTVKRSVGGDLLVIVYPEGKPIDFYTTCVQGNDYLYFIVDTWIFQVCRLR